ncbi:hypothetical protein RB608_23310 [Nocardioides sp. LHD-245]|uniref:hypothetical protein n=1 Tax=Nocardioides sp. LHD-245 TaxID=3051387 RepID=UPI0027DF72F6|nr:hypothetical protein [Nocardioides sp. LHD-245]
MPAPNPDLELSVERNTNDVVALYGLLTDQNRRIAVIEDKVTTIENKVTTIENKVTTIENKVTTIENKVTTIENKVTTIDETLIEHGRQLAEILKRLPPAV